jgi:predicted alpha/beta superfamily hydrolase
MKACTLFLVLVLFAIVVVVAKGDRVFQLNVEYPGEKVALGTSLYVRGDGLGLRWDEGQQLERVSSDLWQMRFNVSARDTAPGAPLLQLKVLFADQIWSIGANFQFNVSSSNSGGQGGVFGATVFPFFFTSAGHYEYIYNVQSPQGLYSPRNVVVYLPPSYAENTRKVYADVMLMHDGQNLFNVSTSAFGSWQCQDTINALVVQGSMRELVIVGVDNTPDRTDEYTYSYDKSVGGGGDGDEYLDFLEQTVLPIVGARYPRVNVASPGIGGSSLGGLISCYAAYTRPAAWPIGMCMSSSFWWNDEDFLATIMSKYPSPVGHAIVYLDSGNSPKPDGDDVLQTKAVRDRFEAQGFTLGTDLFYYLDNGGSHNERSWGRRFHVPMTDLYPPTTTILNYFVSKPKL